MQCWPVQPLHAQLFEVGSCRNYLHVASCIRVHDGQALVPKSFWLKSGGVGKDSSGSVKARQRSIMLAASAYGAVGNQYGLFVVMIADGCLHLLLQAT
jgi:hypothetical protein